MAMQPVLWSATAANGTKCVNISWPPPFPNPSASAPHLPPVLENSRFPSENGGSPRTRLGDRWFSRPPLRQNGVHVRRKNVGVRFTCPTPTGPGTGRSPTGAGISDRSGDRGAGPGDDLVRARGPGPRARPLTPAPGPAPGGATNSRSDATINKGASVRTYVLCFLAANGRTYVRI